jgi:hypothetical protein
MRGMPTTAITLRRTAAALVTLAAVALPASSAVAAPSHGAHEAAKAQQPRIWHPRIFQPRIRGHHGARKHHPRPTVRGTRVP